MSGTVVVDLEATCWEGEPPHPNEIIEIGACVLRENAAAPEPGGFARFVRPVIAPTLSPFCTALTTITQADVDVAAPFMDALPAFTQWIHEATGKPAASILLASWGRYDWRQLEADCARVQTPMPFSRHLNVRRAFATIVRRRLRRPPGLAEALAELALPPEGTPHRALDDARNAARVLVVLLTRASMEDVIAAGGEP